MITDNQLARGIQSKIIRGLGVEPPVESVKSQVLYEPGGLGWRSLPNIKKLLRTIFTFIHEFVIYYGKAIFMGELSLSKLYMSEISLGEMS